MIRVDGRCAGGNKISFEKNMLFAFRALAQSYNVTFLLDKSNACWGDLKTAIKVRDRLMHPKRPGDLSVTDAEMAATRKAHDWLLEQYGVLSELRRKAIDEGRDAPEFDSSVPTDSPNDDV